MELVRYLHNLQSRHKGCVVTIGNFDGVHTGHQAVIRQLQQYAREVSLPAVVVTFEPQPLEYFAPGTAPARLTSFREKMEWLSEHGLDRVVCLRFQKTLAELPARDFVAHLLVQNLGAKYIVVGDDFRFGQGRKGDFKYLQALQADYGYTVVATDTLISDGERVSSSRIRALLTAGRLHEVETLLGRPYSMSGRVIRGDGRGKQLGFATANLALKRNQSPLLGVYAVRVEGLDGRVYPGVANLGTRPVFYGKQVLLEVHLLDFTRDIYGRHLHVNFQHRIRPEQKFASVQELVAQIRRDVESARLLFAGSDRN
ncbi:MAG: Riboflavin biosynthesis protein [Gammaproteobacteria bacterium]|nr:Riboflavin biosynthesis protein [Gammaproteobacteria bacterium]